jgi:hypothetical protein
MTTQEPFANWIQELIAAPSDTPHKRLADTNITTSKIELLRQTSRAAAIALLGTAVSSCSRIAELSHESLCVHMNSIHRNGRSQSEYTVIQGVSVPPFR